MILAIMESNSGGMASPTATPVSMRTPGPVASLNRSIVPGAGAKQICQRHLLVPEVPHQATRILNGPKAAAKDQTVRAGKNTLNLIAKFRDKLFHSVALLFRMSASITNILIRRATLLKFGCGCAAPCSSAAEYSSYRTVGY